MIGVKKIFLLQKINNKKYSFLFDFHCMFFSPRLHLNAEISAAPWSQVCAVLFLHPISQGRRMLIKPSITMASVHSHFCVRVLKRTAMIEELWVQKSQGGEEGWSAEAKQRLNIQLSVCTTTRRTIPKPARKSQGNLRAYLPSVKGHLSCFSKQNKLFF